MPHRSGARGTPRPSVAMPSISRPSFSHQAASHSKKGWETFTTAVLKTVVDRLAPTGAEHGAKGVVFLAWGAPAAKLTVGISEVSFSPSDRVRSLESRYISIPRRNPITCSNPHIRRRSRRAAGSSGTSISSSATSGSRRRMARDRALTGRA